MQLLAYTASLYRRYIRREVSNLQQDSPITHDCYVYNPTEAVSTIEVENPE